MNSSLASLSTFSASSDEPWLVGAPRETVREGKRMLLKERKPGDPRTESGCKEFDRSTMMGDKDTVVTDAADGRRVILSQSHKPVPRRADALEGKDVT